MSSGRLSISRWSTASSMYAGNGAAASLKSAVLRPSDHSTRLDQRYFRHLHIDGTGRRRGRRCALARRRAWVGSSGRACRLRTGRSASQQRRAQPARRESSGKRQAVLLSLDQYVAIGGACSPHRSQQHRLRPPRCSCSLAKATHQMSDGRRSRHRGTPTCLLTWHEMVWQWLSLKPGMMILFANLSSMLCSPHAVNSSTVPTPRIRPSRTATTDAVGTAGFWR